MPQPSRLLFLITGLNTGGAEMMLYKLLSGLDRERYSPAVVSLLAGGAVQGRIEALDVPVAALGMRRGLPGPQTVSRLLAEVRQARPTLIQGWMYHGNLLGELARGVVARGVPTAWNIRHSLDDLALDRPATTALIRGGARLSTRPAAIIYNSRTSAEQHEAIGYDRARRRLLPNGFDTGAFRPDAASRARVRASLGVADEVCLVGLFGRHHAVKNHAGFLRAAARVAASQPDRRFNFLLAGTGVDRQNPELMAQIASLGLQDAVLLLGEREDVPALMQALDLAVSASFTEGFANVIGEAMASGVPCVVTDVGDSAWIVGESGLAVPPRDDEALAAAIGELAAADPARLQALGDLARRRVEDHFSLGSVVAQYEALYDTLLERRPA